MTFEILEPLTLKTKSQGTRALLPGETLEVPEHIGRQLLEQAPGKVRILQPDWQAAWREVAGTTDGIEEADPRFQSLNCVIDRLDDCFLKNDWVGFQRQVGQLKTLLRNRP